MLFSRIIASKDFVNIDKRGRRRNPSPSIIFVVIAYDYARISTRTCSPFNKLIGVDSAVRRTN